MTDKPTTLPQIAARISAHLKRFEADPAINAPCPTYKTRPYYFAGAQHAGRYVGVTYITYQGTSNLTREQAMQYLEALDGGFVGKHYRVFDK